MAELQEQLPKKELEQKPLRIIYIEDQKDFRELIEAELKKFLEVEVVASFGSTEEAKDYLMGLRSEKQELPDAIVSDNDLGNRKATGIEFAKELKKIGFEIPVVLFIGDVKPFKNMSEEQLNGIGLKSIVDKFGLESTENLVGVLKSIKPSIPSQDKPE